MAAYLIDHPGVLRQYSARSSWTPSRPTGLTMLHTSEFPPSWTVAQQAEWLRTRTTPGCYHDIADTRGGDLQMVPYEFGAWQDGTGSNGMAVSIGFVCRTTDWASMTPETRRRTLRAGAHCFARQQAWLRSKGYPATPLRYITRAQSDAGVAGFCCHGWRDPGRRTDPGVSAPNLFPFNEFLTECRAALAGEEDDMFTDEDRALLREARDRLRGDTSRPFDPLQSMEKMVADIQYRVRGHHDALDSLQVIQWQIGQLAAQAPDVDETELAAALAGAIPDSLAQAVVDKLADRLRPSA